MLRNICTYIDLIYHLKKCITLHVYAGFFYEIFMTLLFVVRRQIKFLSREFFYFKRFRGVFDGLFDTSVARVKKTIKKLALTETTHIPNFVKNIFFIHNVKILYNRHFYKVLCLLCLILLFL